jgi:hypothetical protein
MLLEGTMEKSTMMAETMFPDPVAEVENQIAARKIFPLSLRPRQRI